MNLGKGKKKDRLNWNGFINIINIIDLLSLLFGRLTKKERLLIHGSERLLSSKYLK